MTFDLQAVGRVLCVGAHADDIEIGCGGTLLALQQANPHIRIVWAVLSGDDRRRAEAEASCAEFCRAAAQVQFVSGSFRDSYFPYLGPAVKEFFHDLAAAHQPDLIFTHRREDLHQDHRVVAECTWNAFRSHLILEYEIPKYDGDLAAMNVYAPLSPELAERKIVALLEHFPSQRDKPWFRRETFAALLQLRGLEAAAPTRLAEAFWGRKLWLSI